MMTLRHITASEVHHQRRETEREREIKREIEGKKPQPTERKRDRNIFHDGIRLCNF